MSSCSTPIVVGGKKIGCVTVDIELSAITNIIGNIKVGETGVGILTGADGLLIAGYDDAKVQEGANLTADENASVVKMMSTILTDTNGVTSYSDGKKDYKVYFDTIGLTGWKLMVAIQAYELMQPIYQLINRLIVVCIVAIIVAIVIIVIGIGGVAKTIRKVQGFATRLAEGDFTIDSLSIKGKDELAVMSTSLNEMYVNNKGVIQSIADYSVEINEASSTLKASAQELKIEFDKIVDVMGDVNSDMMNSSAATEQLSASVDQVAQSTDNLNDERKGSLELAIDIQKRAAEIGKNSQEAFDKSQTLQTSFQTKLEDSIAQSKVVESIGEMASVIADIADQITLLSLNASIEAARAGEAGKGFAVVAEEIGKLADDSNQSANEIRNQMSALLVESHSAVEMAKEVRGVTESQKDILDTTISSIDNLIHQINSTVQGVNAITDNAEACESSRDVIVEVMNSLSAISEENAASCQETSASVQELNATVNTLASAAEDLKEVSDTLIGAMEFFQN